MAKTEAQRPDAAVMLDDIPFERLFDVLRHGGDLEAWNDGFGAIVAQVAERLRSRFREAELAESAALSAVATFVRRLREGEPDSKLDRVDGRDTLVGYLVLRAHHKAWEKLHDQWRRKSWPVDLDQADLRNEPSAEVADASDSDFIRSAVRAEMSFQLRHMLDRMNLLLGTARQRRLSH